MVQDGTNRVARKPRLLFFRRPERHDEAKVLVRVLPGLLQRRDDVDSLLKGDDVPERDASEADHPARRASEREKATLQSQRRHRGPEGELTSQGCNRTSRRRAPSSSALRPCSVSPCRRGDPRAAQEERTKRRTFSSKSPPALVLISFGEKRLHPACLVSPSAITLAEHVSTTTRIAPRISGPKRCGGERKREGLNWLHDARR